MKTIILKNATLTKFGLNLWPPFLLSGIKIIQLDKNFKYCKVKLKNWIFTKNMHQTQFGGNLFAMTDPMYALMLMGILGKNYYIWDKSAFIDFISPGKKDVFADFTITDTIINEIIHATKNGDKYFIELNCQIKDKSDNLIANVNKKLYIRLKPQFRPKNHY